MLFFYFPNLSSGLFEGLNWLLVAFYCKNQGGSLLYCCIFNLLFGQSSSVVKLALHKKTLLSFCWHSLLWGAVLLFFTQFLKFQTEDFGKILSFSLLLMPVTILSTYTTIYYLLPNYLLPKHYWSFLLYSIYLIIVSAYLIVLSIYGGLIFLSQLKAGEMLPLSQSLLVIFIGVFVVVFIASSFSLAQQHHQTSTQNQVLAHQLLERELLLQAQKLEYLKMQIHPHFLFNTLNTIYGHALQQSNYTADMILKLSNLLDYLLYQTNESLVELEQEIQHIQDYIALEQVRFQDILQVNFEVDNTSSSFLIPPMLLLPFVENAFKHGSIQQGVFKINLQVKAKKEGLFFSISNSFDPAASSQHSGGLGLQNIKKRLALLYGENYQLSIQQQAPTFQVELFIKPLHQ